MKKLIFLIISLTAVLFALSSCGHEHSFGNWEITTDSTCSDAGVKIRKCECGETETADVQKKNHTITEVPQVNPGCTTEGHTRGTYCEVCGVYVEKPEPIASTHKYTSKVLINPSCTSAGMTVYTCLQCGSSYSEEIKPLGHNIKAATCTEPESCSACNYTSGLPLGHTTKLGLCERCNQYAQPSVALPKLPITSTVETVGLKTVMKITDISTRIANNTLTITYSGMKIEDNGILANGNYFCGFSYRLYDANGNLVASGRESISGLSVGDSFKDRAFVIENLQGLSEYYVLEISDYK